MKVQDRIQQDLNNIYLGNIYTVEANLTLPEYGRHGTRFTWATEYPHIIDEKGYVTRPRHTTGDRTVELTATGTLEGETGERRFQVTVLEQESVNKIQKTVRSTFYASRDALDQLPPFGIVEDENGVKSVQPVRWRVPLEVIPEDVDTLEIKGVQAYSKGMVLMDDTQRLQFEATVKLTDDAPVVETPAMKLESFPLDAVVIHEGRFETNRKLMEEHLRSVDVDQLLYNFRLAAGLDTKGAPPMTGWDAEESKLRGHTTGHYLSAMVLAYVGTPDEETREVLGGKVADLLDGLEEVQTHFSQSGLANYGFLSAYSEEQFDLLEEYVTYPNIWAPYYTLHKIVAGLLDAYEYAGSEQAMNICRKLMIWQRNRFAKLDNKTLQTMWSMYIAGEYGGMNDVVARFMRLEQDQSYAEVFKAFDNDKLFYPLTQNIDAISLMHANQHIPQIIGALTYYTASGEREYYDIADNFWQIATRDHIYSIGGIGEGELFRPTGQISRYITDKTAEGCASYNMLKLTRDLYLYEATPDYMDYYERTLFNHIVPSLEPDVPSGGSTYFMPLAPGSTLGYDDDANSCCHGTGLENHVKLQEAVYFLENDAEDAPVVRVDQYLQSVVVWDEKGIGFTQTEPVITAQAASYRLDRAGRLTFKFRVPTWVAEVPTITVNGESVDVVEQDGYLTVSGDWAEGDVVAIALPFALVTEATPDREDLVSLKYGPYTMSILSDATDYLELPAVETLEAEWTPVVGEEAVLTYKWNGMIFRAHHASKGEPFHIYMITEGVTQ